MTWKKGQSGNPGGRSTNDKPLTDALRIAVNETDPVTKKRKLRVIAEKLVECAIGGEPWAINQVFDRLEGKPAQENTLTVEHKRDRSDWSRDELVAWLADAGARRPGTTDANGRDDEPDQVH